MSTVRQVQGWLAAEGLISVEPGRGTFVRAPVGPAVLLVAAEATVEEPLAERLTECGYRLVAAPGPAEGLAALKRDAAIDLVLIDICNLALADGVQFIRLVRHRWPRVPLAVLVTALAQLLPLCGTPEWPLLIVTKPIHPRQLDELLRLTLPQAAASRQPTTEEEVRGHAMAARAGARRRRIVRLAPRLR